jgi:hypothetical protein
MSARRTLSQLERLAVEAAISAPLKQGKYVGEARVDWLVIDALRAECERLGIDWRELTRERLKVAEERRKLATEERRRAYAERNARSPYGKDGGAV